MEQPKEIQELNERLRPRWLSGLWNVDHAERPSDPKTRVKPHLWKWDDVYDSLLQAKEKISVASGTVERRVGVAVRRRVVLPLQPKRIPGGCC